MLGAREQQVSEGEIPRGLGVGRTTIGRTRGAYLETGLASALADAPRPGRPRTYGPKVAAEISAWACTCRPGGSPSLDAPMAPRASPAPGRSPRDQPRNHPAHSNKNFLRPWREVRWCGARMTGEDRERRDALVALYAPPYEAAEPVVWLAEKSQQWWADTRPPVALAPGRPGKEDHESTRPGTRNPFVAVAPKGNGAYIVPKTFLLRRLRRGGPGMVSNRTWRLRRCISWSRPWS